MKIGANRWKQSSSLFMTCYPTASIKSHTQVKTLIRNSRCRNLGSINSLPSYVRFIHDVSCAGPLTNFRILSFWRLMVDQRNETK